MPSPLVDETFVIIPKRLLSFQERIISRSVLVVPVAWRKVTTAENVRDGVDGVTSRGDADCHRPLSHYAAAPPLFWRHDRLLVVRLRFPVSCRRHSSQPYSTTATSNTADRQYSLVVLHTAPCSPNASAMPAYRKK